MGAAPPKAATNYHMVAIGSGAGGYTAANRAGQLGLKTACAEGAAVQVSATRSATATATATAATTGGLTPTASASTTPTSSATYSATGNGDSHHGSNCNPDTGRRQAEDLT